MPRKNVKPRLSRERVLTAALTIVDAEGLGALSMRRLGRALGVEAMSLYRHVRNKSDLLDAVHDHVLSQMVVPRRGGRWRRDAAAMALAFRDVLYEHANAIPLFLERPAVTAGSLAHFERGLAILVDAGLEPLDALRVFQAIYALVVGHCAFHFAPNEGEAEAVDYAALDADVFPILSSLDLEDYDPDTELDLALEALLRGVKAR